MARFEVSAWVKGPSTQSYRIILACVPTWAAAQAVADAAHQQGIDSTFIESTNNDKPIFNNIRPIDPHY